MKRLVISLVLALVLFLSVGTPALACECGLDSDEDYGALSFKVTSDPNRFAVFMRFGEDHTDYINNREDILKGDIEAVGEYNDTLYMLTIPAGCAIERPSHKRLNQLYLREITDGTLTFTHPSVTFSEPCVLYVAVGEMRKDRLSREWIGEWEELGSFTSIVDSVATLE